MCLESDFKLNIIGGGWIADSVRMVFALQKLWQQASLIHCRSRAKTTVAGVRTSLEARLSALTARLSTHSKRVEFTAQPSTARESRRRASRGSFANRLSIGDGTGIAGGIRQNSNDRARVLLLHEARASFKPISFRKIRARVHETNQHEAITHQDEQVAFKYAQAQRLAGSLRRRRKGTVQTGL